ncbi:unnamed protein product [Lymnaea stagnalis]|uniref:VWFD domain-containing protein n=1 Tax=Lymnaea stagnalis TaxID=6523 RepID=A0AAV2H4C7_LYMST
MTTFDKLRYNNMIAGEFVMYRHSTLPYEVRSLYRHCSALNTRVTCNCGASVRVGDDVIVFNTCDARQNLPPFNHVGSSVINVEIYKNGEFTPGTRIKRIGSGQKYEVYLPTGTKVTVSAAKKPFMDIHVTGSATDLSRSEGLCGNFDGNPNNDLQGVVADTFSRRWLRTATIFNGVQANASYSVPQYCSCIAGQQAVCEAGLDVFKCSAESRNPADVTASLVRLAKTPMFGQQQARFRRAVESEQAPLVASGSRSFTESEAREFCNIALQNSSATMACIEHLSNVSVSESIKSCTDDLNITGDPEWALSHLSDITQECLSTARQNASAWESPEAQGGEPALSAELRTNLCTKDCGANGDCVNADCVCKNGYTGEVCTVEPNALPVIATAYLACDILSSSCSSVTIVGLNFHASPDLTCHFEYVTVGATVTKTGVMVNVPAAYISMYQVECTQPNVRGQSAIIRVSNDKTTQSNESYLHVIHKSSCQQCYFADGGKSASCTWMADTCVIDSQCYARHEIFADDSCYRCDPDKRTDSWTRLSEPRCLATAQPISASDTSSDSNDTVVIVLGVITGVLCLAVLVIAIFLLKRRFKRKQRHLQRFDDDLQVDLSRSRAAQTSSGLDLHSRTEGDKQEAIYNPTFN